MGCPDHECKKQQDEEGERLPLTAAGVHGLWNEYTRTIAPARAPRRNLETAADDQESAGTFRLTLRLTFDSVGA